jgi:tetratricopeptide (TPR) repeat protein
MGPAYYHGGQASYALGNYENAKNYYLQAGDHYVQVPDYWWAGDSYSWAGNIAYEQGEYDAAIYYYLLSAQNFLGIPDYKRTGDAYHGAGNSASTKGDCPKACCMYWGEAKYYYDLAEYDYNIPPICDQVMVWTGGDGTDGHFISEWNGWEERASAILTVHVRVLEGDQPVEEAEIFFQGISQGQTDNNGHLRFLFPIIAIDPIMTGPLVTTVEARWNGISAVSEPTLIYESKSLSE